jgi:hypothetical protein
MIAEPCQWGLQNQNGASVVMENCFNEGVSGRELVEISPCLRLKLWTKPVAQGHGGQA